MVRLILNKKLKAVSIIESLVALVILSITFGVGMMVYFNVLTNSAIPVRIKAIIIAEKVAHQTKVDKRYLNERLNIQNLHFNKTVKKYNYGESIYWLNIEVYQNKKLLYNYKELITNSEE